MSPANWLVKRLARCPCANPASASVLKFEISSAVITANWALVNVGIVSDVKAATCDADKNGIAAVEILSRTVVAIFFICSVVKDAIWRLLNAAAWSDVNAFKLVLISPAICVGESNAAPRLPRA